MIVLTVPIVACAGWIIQAAYKDLARDSAKLAGLPALQSVWAEAVVVDGTLPNDVLAAYPACAPEKTGREACEEALAGQSTDKLHW